MTPQHNTPTRGTSRRAALALSALLIPHAARAEVESELDPLIVSALRVPRPESEVTSTVTSLDPRLLENQGVFLLQDALNRSPGVISTSTAGESGAIGSLFIRGTKTADSLIVVDGVRLSDSNAQLGNLLTASRIYDIGNLEVLRGAQGAIYGGESIGGVLWLETPRGSGDPGGSFTVEGGSFNSFSARSKFHGEVGDLSYFLSGGYEETDNDAPGQHFHQINSALRVEGRINETWSLGTTFRLVDNRYEASPLDIQHFDSALGTIYLTGEISDRWTTRFRVSHQRDAYDQDDSTYFDPNDPFSFPSHYNTDLEATSFSTDQEITLSEQVRLLAGAFYHRDTFQSSSSLGGDLADKKGKRYGTHATLEWDILDELTTTASVRWEDYDTFGDEATWRLGSVYTFQPTQTTIRAGIGRSFRTPTYQDLFYQSSWYTGNPDLKPQSSMGWDIGAEQKIGANHTLGATWFNNRIKDTINSFASDGLGGFTAANLPGKTTTEGLEVGLRGEWQDTAISYQLAWTHLNKSLADHPRNALNASLDWKPCAKSLIGVGATHLSDRSWGGTPIASYTIARLHGSYQITENLKLHARVENLFNESYELSNFYGTVVQGPGTGVYCGITVDW